MAGACTGAALWSKRFGTSGESEKLDFATTDAAGNLYITGRFEKDIDFGPAGILTDYIGDDETFVAKLDPSGVPIWARALRSRGYSRPIGIGVDAAGNVVVAGDAEVSINFGGDTTYESPEGLAFLVSWDAAGTRRYDRAEPRPLLNATTLAVAADGRVAMTGLPAASRSVLKLGGGRA